MLFEERKDGLLLPQAPPQKPGRECKALEITHDEDRREVHDLLEKLLNAGPMRVGGIMLYPREAVLARRDLVLFVARQLLGDDFSWGELC